MNRTLVITMAVLAAALVMAIGVLYVFGTPQAAPQVPADYATGTADEAPIEALGNREEPSAERPAATSNEAPPPDPNSPLAIEIPGCTCHSDDPKLVKQHESYRMNQCAGCHAGQVPTGQ